MNTQWRIENFQRGIESARDRITEIEQEISPLMEERQSLLADINRWAEIIASLKQEVSRDQ